MLTVAGGILLAIFILFTLPLWLVVARFVLALAFIAAIVMLGATLVRAEDAPPEVPEEIKVNALMLGYILNDRSMVRWGSIDISRAVRGLPQLELASPPPQELIGPPAPANGGKKR